MRHSVCQSVLAFVLDRRLYFYPRTLYLSHAYLWGIVAGKLCTTALILVLLFQHIIYPVLGIFNAVNILIVNDKQKPMYYMLKRKMLLDKYK